MLRVRASAFASSDEEEFAENPENELQGRDMRGNNCTLQTRKNQEKIHFDEVENALQKVALLTDVILAEPDRNTEEYGELLVTLQYESMKIRKAKTKLKEKCDAVIRAQGRVNVERAYKQAREEHTRKKEQEEETMTRKRRLDSIDEMMETVQTVCRTSYSDDEKNYSIVKRVKTFLGLDTTVPADIPASAGTLIRCGTEVKMGSTHGFMVSLLCKCFFLVFLLNFIVCAECQRLVSPHCRTLPSF